MSRAASALSSASSNTSRFRQIRPRKSWAGWIVALVIVLAFTVMTRQSNAPTEAFDVDSTQPMGTRGLVMLLERFGGNVTVGNNPRGSTAMLFFDNLSEDETANVTNWVRSGGTLVVADADSSFAGIDLGGANAFRQPRSLTPQCNSDLVDGVTSIEPHRRNRYQVFEGPTLASTCFPAADGSFMVEGRLGSGRVVVLGTGNIFTNSQLDKADNSVLAMNLLRPNGSGVTILETRDITTAGDDELADLLPESVVAMTWQLAIAGALLMLWRSRRVGKPVVEAALVELPGSQLTIATGNLLQNAGELDGAARILRNDLRRGIAELIGVSGDTDPRLLAAAVSERTGVDRARLLDAIVDRPLTSSRELVELAQTIEDLHREVANAR